MRQVDGAGDMFLRKGRFGTTIHHHERFTIADCNMKVPGIHLISQLALVMGHLFD
jgi:hypothetical protein